MEAFVVSVGECCQDSAKTSHSGTGDTGAPGLLIGLIVVAVSAQAVEIVLFILTSDAFLLVIQF